MSLVAYGASDDSETSDVEEAETAQTAKSRDTITSDRAFADDGKISDEEDYVPTASITTTASHASSTNDIGVGLSVSAPSNLKDLPAPKPVSSSASQGGGQGDGDDELEEEVKPKASQLADAPKPPPKKTKQPARIVIPALKQDSDEEEDESKKKAKQSAAVAGSGSRSGLFALLPPPSHGTRKQSNRPLIPYTLTKRPAAPSKDGQAASKAKSLSSQPSSTTAAEASLPSQKHQSAFNALTGYESDSDDEDAGPGTSGGISFFSLGSESGETPVVKNCAPSLQQGEGEKSVRTSDIGSGSQDVADAPSSTSVASKVTPPPLVTQSESPVSSSSGVSSSAAADSVSAAGEKSQDSTVGEEEDSDDDAVSSTVGVPQFNQDAPLNFNSSMQRGGWSTAPLVSPMLPEMYAVHSSSSSGANYWQQQHYAQDYSAEELESGASSSSSSNIQQYMEDEQFLRISGKRKRASQEDIQIIDANVDDYVDSGDLMKGITEESSYQPHRKKDNMPSQQQKRKKQITYLAFQAKEKELELKNAWSQNRMTKNQSRSKYGF